ncbi:MAG: hypothetical protein AAFY59_11640 [Pseudomonadota bacterium]
MRYLLTGLLALFLSVGLALATNEAEDGLVDIGKDEWFAMVSGRTVVYKIGPEYWAYETYSKKSNYVIIQLANGECMEGTWEHVNNTFCFAWDNGEYSCFRHARDGDEILIIPTVDGQPSGTIQTVSEITSDAVPCGPELTS